MNARYAADDGLITGVARVVGVDASHAWLAAEQPSACSSCATQGVCGSGTAKVGSRWQVPRALGPGQIPLAVGERVHIGVDRSALTRASLVAYSLPLFTMLAAVVAVQGAGDMAAVLGAVAGLAVGAAAARKLVRRWREALAPVVLGRAENLASSPCAPANPPAPRSIPIGVINRRSL